MQEEIIERKKQRWYGKRDEKTNQRKDLETRPANGIIGENCVTKKQRDKYRNKENQIVLRR